MRIEHLNISEECINQLRRTGATMVEELVEFLDQSVGTGVSVHVHWATQCFEEITRQLKLQPLAGWLNHSEFGHDA
jgi:hypothetical protein